MITEIIPTSLCGNIKAIPSKSHIIRLIIAAILSKGSLSISEPYYSDDISAALKCAVSLGMNVSENENSLILDYAGSSSDSPSLDFNDCAALSRMLLPCVCAEYETASYNAGFQLASRPIKPLLDSLSQNGVIFSGNSFPLSHSGILRSGDFSISVSETSQYLSGLLFALPLLDGKSTIKLTGEPVSKDYISLTLSVLCDFGINIEHSDCEYIIENSRFISPLSATAISDLSSSLPFILAKEWGEKIEITSSFSDIEAMRLNDAITKIKSGNAEIDISDIPDFVPCLAVFACDFGKTKFTNARRLKYKESDRNKAVCALISSLGGKAYEEENGFSVIGNKLKGGRISSFNDHRIIMAAALASCRCKEPIIIENSEYIKKSYPSFFEDFISLGGNAHAFNR